MSSGRREKLASLITWLGTWPVSRQVHPRCRPGTGNICTLPQSGKELMGAWGKYCDMPWITIWHYNDTVQAFGIRFSVEYWQDIGCNINSLRRTLTLTQNKAGNWNIPDSTVILLTHSDISYPLLLYLSLPPLSSYYIHLCCLILSLLYPKNVRNALFRCYFYSRLRSRGSDCWWLPDQFRNICFIYVHFWIVLRCTGVSSASGTLMYHY